MPTKDDNQFDQIFSGPRYIHNSDGVVVVRNDGTRPIHMQFVAPFVSGYNQATDRIEVGMSGAGSVPGSRTLYATSPLRIDGGASGDLSLDRTFALLIDNTSIVVAGGALEVGAIDNIQHGIQTDGTLHADASNVTAGFMPPGMYTLLDTATNIASTGTLFRRDSFGSGELYELTVTGSLIATPTPSLTINVGGGEPITAADNEVVLGNNVTVGAQSVGDPDAYQSGVGVMWFAPAGAEPTAAPTSGIYMWYRGGSLKVWKAGAGAPVVLV